MLEISFTPPFFLIFTLYGTGQIITLSTGCHTICALQLLRIANRKKDNHTKQKDGNRKVENQLCRMASLLW